MGYVNIFIIAFLMVFVTLDPIPIQSPLIDGAVITLLANQCKTILNNLEVS